MNKQLFDEVIGEVPPATFDVDGLVTRGRRAVRVRRVVNPTVAAGVAVLLLSGAVAFSLTNDDDSGPARVGGQSTTSAATDKNDTTTTTPETADPVSKPPAACANPDDLESPAEAAARLGAAARALVAAQRPELQLSPNMTGAGRGPLEVGYESDKHVTESVCDEYGDFLAAATTEGPEGKGNVVISLGARYYAYPLTCAGLEARYCEVVTGPNGEDIMKVTDVATNNVTAKMVEVVKPDGTRLLLTAENVATSAESGGEATAPQPPLDYDQLIAIGTDSTLTLFP